MDMHKINICHTRQPKLRATLKTWDGLDTRLHTRYYEQWQFKVNYFYYGIFIPIHAQIQLYIKIALGGWGARGPYPCEPVQLPIHYPGSLLPRSVWSPHCLQACPALNNQESAWKFQKYTTHGYISLIIRGRSVNSTPTFLKSETRDLSSSEPFLNIGRFLGRPPVARRHLS